MAVTSLQRKLEHAINITNNITRHNHDNYENNVI